MASIIYVGVFSVLWIVNLFNGTGLDTVYHVTALAKYAVLVIAFILFILKSRSENIKIERSDFYFFFFMGVVFFASSFFQNYGMMAIDYLWILLLVYCLSKMPLEKNVIRLTGLIYGIGGITVLYIYDYGSFFSGWNENSIAMIGMHSFLVFIVQFFDEKNPKNRFLLVVFTAVFSYLIFPTDSRSCILFAMLGALFALGFIPRRWFFEKRGRIVLLLLLPLIIAIAVSIVSNSSVFDSLNEWSYEKFKKPIFNGRDEMWISGFKRLLSDFVFGNGNLNADSFHNSAITCLVAYGAVGYSLWIGSFYRIITHIKKYIDDYLVKGALISFVVLYVQQSVELGFIASNPSIIAYVLLGIALGRAKYLKRKKQYV